MSGRARFSGSMRARIRPVLRENNGGASGLAYDLQGRLYICESDARRVTRLDPKGKIETLAEGFEGKKFNAPNDIVVRRDGHVYFTDPGVWQRERPPRTRFLRHLACLAQRRSRRFREVANAAQRHHALARWQAALRQPIPTATRSLRSISTATARQQISATSSRTSTGVPGGIKTDVDGRLYVAASGVASTRRQGKLAAHASREENGHPTARLAKPISSRSSSRRAAMFSGSSLA